MNNRQKEVLQAQLKSEEDLIKAIKRQYEQAIRDINLKIQFLSSGEITQSRLYQLEFQKALKSQISEILDKMNKANYTTINDYLEACYYEAFLGTLYDLQGQGIPLIFPIAQNQVVKAIQLDTKLSKSLYKTLGININVLKKHINNEIARGISSGLMYGDIARNIKNRAFIDFNKAIRIARTEGHRISQEATYEVQTKAKEAGASVIREWSSALDNRTRKSHRKLNGQFRDINEAFEVNGHKVMYPGRFGIPHEDINCRCSVLQRATWALSDREYKRAYGKERNEVVIDSKNFADFKQQYDKSIKEV